MGQMVLPSAGNCIVVEAPFNAQSTVNGSLALLMIVLSKMRSSFDNATDNFTISRIMKQMDSPSR